MPETHQAALSWSVVTCLERSCSACEEINHTMAWKQDLSSSVVHSHNAVFPQNTRRHYQVMRLTDGVVNVSCVAVSLHHLHGLIRANRQLEMILHFLQLVRLSFLSKSSFVSGMCRRSVMEMHMLISTPPLLGGAWSCVSPPPLRQSVTRDTYRHPPPPPCPQDFDINPRCGMLRYLCVARNLWAAFCHSLFDCSRDGSSCCAEIPEKGNKVKRWAGQGTLDTTVNKSWLSGGLVCGSIEWAEGKWL